MRISDWSSDVCSSDLRYSLHQRRGDILGGIDADHRRLGREAAHFGDKGARRGHREMRAHRIDALLLLNEDEAVGVLDIDMAMMRQTPRLPPRSRAMLGAERDPALAMRSAERRVGKECVSTGRIRWSPDN